MSVKKLLNNYLHTPKWLAVLLAIVLILRIPSFFIPYSYGDEMIYLTLGEGIRQRVPLYLGLHDNKPPLLYVLAAIAGSLFWFKAILAIWNLVTIFLFWKLIRVLFPSRTKNGKKPENILLQRVSTVIFAILTTIPLFEGNIANAEIFMIGPIIGAFLILLGKRKTPKKLIISGILFSIAAFFKVPAAFDLPVIIAFWIIAAKITKNNFKQIVINSLYLALGFIVPIAISFVYYAARGAFNEYLVAAFLQNFGYVSSWRPDDFRQPFLVKNLPLLLRGGVVLCGITILYWKRKVLSKPFMFATVWLLFSLFAATLSERPYPHYLLQAIPSISILFGILLTDKSIIQSVAVLPLTLAFFVPFYYDFWYYPTTSYYTRFIEFASKQISKEDYMLSFGGNVIANYEVSEFITKMTSKDDRIFVWGDNSTIYALSRRLPTIKYVVDYHINDFSSQDEVISWLKNNPPKLIIILPDAEPFPQLVSFVNKQYIYLSDISGVEVWKYLNPQANSLITH